MVHFQSKRTMTRCVWNIGLWMNRSVFLLAERKYGVNVQFLRNCSTNDDSGGANAAESHTKKRSIKDIPDADIKKSVFISQSHDIFTNLALEDWLYRNFDFTTHHVLMLWSNDPCVVVGRHQNP